MPSVLETRAKSKTLLKVYFEISATHAHTSTEFPSDPSHLLLCSSCMLAADIISTVEFDSTGNYLATGDKGGRVVLFERNEMVRISTSHCHPSRGCVCRAQLIYCVLHVIFRVFHVPRDYWLSTEKRLRVQVLHRIPVSRARVRLPQVAGD